MKKLFLVLFLFLLIACSNKENGYLIANQSADGLTLFLSYQWRKYNSSQVIVQFISGGVPDRDVPADITAAGLIVHRTTWGSVVNVTLLEIYGSRPTYKSYVIDANGNITKL